MQKVILFLLCAWLLNSAVGYGKWRAAGSVHWLNVNEAASGLQKEMKPVLIDLYTDWCGWCKVMDKKTYSNKKVAAYVEDKFYPVKLNAESTETIVWENKTYPFNQNYRANEFAVYLTQGRLEFPSTVIIPVNGGQPQSIPGYLDPKDFELIARYFGEGNYGKIAFEQFRKHFKSTW